MHTPIYQKSSGILLSHVVTGDLFVIHAAIIIKLIAVDFTDDVVDVDYF